tara:strand:+ start:16300 stop:16866 length:567 start_codon:yes stop_codon:yes gene_type:complete
MTKSPALKGLKELDAYLSALPKNMQTGAYRAGLTAAARVVRDEARQRAPKASGKMAKAIKTGSARRNADGTFSVTVRLDDRGNNHAFLGLFFEFGVAPHYIASTGPGQGRVAVRKAVNSGTKIGGVMKIGDRFVSGVIHHPGHAAKPFLRPALDAKEDEAIRAFADKIRAYIEGKTGFDPAAGMADAA